MEKQRVLWLASWYPNREMPFYGTFVRRHAESVAPHADVAVLTVVASTAFDWVHEKTPLLDEVCVYYPNNRFLKPVFYVLAGLWGYFYIYRRVFKPTILHVNVIYPIALVLWCVRLWHKIPFVITEHWTGYKPEDGGYERASVGLKWLTRWCVRRAHTVLSLSDYYAAAMQAHGLRGRYLSVPNVVNTALFKPNNRPKTTDFFRLLHVSGLDDRQKNITGLLEATALLAARRQDFRLDIIGDATEHAAHIATAKRLGIYGSFCFFHPFMSQADIAVAMQNSHLFLLFSRFEGLPCVILEALATGLPVIATETGGMSDWIQPHNGSLVASEDSESFVAAIDHALSHYVRYNATEISQNTVKKCAYEAIGNTLLSVYQSVINHPIAV